MKKNNFSALILTLLIAFGMNDTALAQQSHGNPRGSSHYSRTGNVLRGLETVERMAEYAMLGNRLSKLDDYTGIRLGYNSASLRAAGFIDAYSESIPGANVGIVFGWFLGKSPVSIEPGVFYSMKGGKLCERALNSDTKYTMHSFEVPVVFKLNQPISSQAMLQPFVGGFMSFGFAGTTTVPGENKYDTFDNGVFEDLDAGLRFGLGITAKPLYFEVAYDLGLLNLCDRGWFADVASMKTRTWSFDIGFNF